jgi:hypothetical protein
MGTGRSKIDVALLRTGWWMMERTAGPEPTEICRSADCTEVESVPGGPSSYEAPMLLGGEEFVVVGNPMEPPPPLDSVMIQALTIRLLQFYH